MTLDELLLSHLWSVWLDYRLPHYEQMAGRASKTLTGSKAAAVRTAYNGRTGQPEPGHVTLFTLADETPDPATTVAAAEELCPVWDVLHHELVDGIALPANSAEPQDPRAEHLAQALRDLFDQSAKASLARSDPRTPPDAKARLNTQVATAAAELATQIEQALTEGLQARHGSFLKPAAVIQSSMLDDWHAYRFLSLIRKSLRGFATSGIDTWRPDGIAVCQSCTAVFTPQRSTSDYCRLCRKRRSQHDVLGAAPFDPSAPVTVRVPKLIGNVVVGWGSTTIQTCTRCGAPFAGRSDAKACSTCSAAARQQRHRDRSDGPDGSAE